MNPDLIVSPKSFWQWKVTESQVPEIRTWTYLGSHGFVCHTQETPSPVESTFENIPGILPLPSIPLLCSSMRFSLLCLMTVPSLASLPHCAFSAQSIFPISTQVTLKNTRQCHFFAVPQGCTTPWGAIHTVLCLLDGLPADLNSLLKTHPGG